MQTYSDWPSYPQLFIKGRFIGGCDILEEMDGSGDFASLFGAACAPGKQSASNKETLESLINSAEIMLFMKVGFLCCTSSENPTI